MLNMRRTQSSLTLLSFLAASTARLPVALDLPLHCWGRMALISASKDLSNARTYLHGVTIFAKTAESSTVLFICLLSVQLAQMFWQNWD